jgi:hypothetical protein
MFPIQKKSVTRAPGDGRNSRRKRRLEAKLRGDQDLLQAPFFHGHTQPGRLELVDKAWLIWVTSLLQKHPLQDNYKNSLLLFDIGIGDQPETTLEWSVIVNTWIHQQINSTQILPPPNRVKIQQSLQSTVVQNPYALVVGTEIDWNRLARAKQIVSLLACNSSTSHAEVIFEWGGTNFQLPHIATTCNHADNDFSERRLAHFIRAMNVFRDYHIHDTCVGIMKLYRQLHFCQYGSSGMLLEGSTNATGSIAVALVLIRQLNYDNPEIPTKTNYSGSTERVPINGVIFAINLDKVVHEWQIEADKEYFQNDCSPRIDDQRESNNKDSSPPHWFRSTLPRLWRHCFDNDDKRHNLPAWSQSMFNFLSTWHELAEECQRKDQSSTFLFNMDIWLESTKQLAKLYNLCMEGIQDGVLIWMNPHGLYIPIPAETLEQSKKKCGLNSMH